MEYLHFWWIVNGQNLSANSVSPYFSRYLTHKKFDANSAIGYGWRIDGELREGDFAMVDYLWAHTSFERWNGSYSNFDTL